METYSLLLEKEYFKFSCAHFLIFPNGEKERLHGHNYHVRCEISGELTDKGILIDFIQVKPFIRELCDYLDEHWIIPEHNSILTYNHRDDGHTEVQFNDMKYLAPSEEIIVLPINNTSAENLAAWFARSLHSKLVDEFGSMRVKMLRIYVSETSGQSGVFTMSEDV